jgi:hypothetical protein
MNDKQGKTVADYLLEVYQKSGLSRRRFLRRMGLKITGAGVLFAALTGKAKGCPCGSCNVCNSCNGCNATCDVDICDDDNVCEPANICTYNVCLTKDSCESNICTHNRCEKSNICTSDTCDWDICPGEEDICKTNTCYAGNPCGTNICVDDDLCLVSNVCTPTDIDCGWDDISCPLGNCVAPNEPF